MISRPGEFPLLVILLLVAVPYHPIQKHTHERDSTKPQVDRSRHFRGRHRGRDHRAVPMTGPGFLGYLYSRTCSMLAGFSTSQHQKCG